MALARIISQSFDGSRELALDLLARGYAVEVVSPDKVPDRVADLELRVEPGGRDNVLANIASREGAPANSFNLLRPSNSPTGRRALEATAAARSSGRPVKSDATPSLLAGGWFLRAAAGFTAVIVLAGAFAMGVRRSNAGTLVQNAGFDLQNIVAGSATSAYPAPEPQPAATLADQGKRTGALQDLVERASQAVSPKPELSQGTFRIDGSHGTADGVRVPAAIIEHEKSPAQVAMQSPEQKRRRIPAEELLAPDTVTYFDRAMTAKAGVQASNRDAH